MRVLCFPHPESVLLLQETGLASSENGHLAESRGHRAFALAAEIATLQRSAALEALAAFFKGGNVNDGYGEQ